eukprot:CAMPEP_0119069558 /NCGR_PEP_ID=MMETSP1178-20130426/24306_1 /TAXON_ID=33656 /ORGANISM="unid sp, Strain CCMP2000" /LENGTH=235 /DNA_ID=CAMNT_0007051333 /DNA_START=32 /DNA_END=741 /DNA_ORIENTATION=-
MRDAPTGGGAATQKTDVCKIDGPCDHSAELTLLSQCLARPSLHHSIASTTAATHLASSLKLLCERVPAADPVASLLWCRCHTPPPGAPSPAGLAAAKTARATRRRLSRRAARPASRNDNVYPQRQHQRRARHHVEDTEGDGRHDQRPAAAVRERPPGVLHVAPHEQAQRQHQRAGQGEEVGEGAVQHGRVANPPRRDDAIEPRARRVEERRAKLGDAKKEGLVDGANGQQSVAVA